MPGRHPGQRDLGDRPGLGRDHPAAGQRLLAVASEQLDLNHGVGCPGDGDLQGRSGVGEAGLGRQRRQTCGILDVQTGHDLVDGRARCPG